jgi:sortase (surface protein transpeptidase)
MDHDAQAVLTPPGTAAEGADVPAPGAALPPERWRTVVRTVGELLVTAGLVLLLFVVYALYVTDVITDRRQGELKEELREEWTATPPGQPHVSILGDGLAVLHIPRLGADYERVVVEGTAEEQLRQGPGHYEDTALPGEQGNLAIAGHRVGKGSPFLELDLLQPGDPIVVETADSWFVYRVLGDPATGDFRTDPSGIPGQQIVRPEAIEVISPTPGAPESAAPSGAYLTLTTCHPRYSARQRLIVHARLDGTGSPKTELPDGPPALHES